MIRETQLPTTGGAYALLIETREPVKAVLRGASFRLDPGDYLYCGSARGPGGIRARVGRHMRKKKALRWHIDRLTVIGCVRGVIVAPGGSECGLFQRFAAIAQADVPIPGFGSSDCRHCPAHLLRIGNLIGMAGNFRLRRPEYLVVDED